MASQIEIQRSLEAVAVALNEGGLDDFDNARIQPIVDRTLAGGLSLRVDGGGGLHDPSGARVGPIRRAPSGEWIIDGQNAAAARADADIPAAALEHREPGQTDQEQR